MDDRSYDGSSYINYAIAKNSPALPLVDDVVLRCFDAGLQDKFLSQHLPMEQVVRHKPENPPLGALKMYMLYAPLMFCAAGAILAAVALAGETCRGRGMPSKETGPETDRKRKYLNAWSGRR